MYDQQQPSSDDKPPVAHLDLGFVLQAARLGAWEVDPISKLVNWDDRCRALHGLSQQNQLPIPYEQTRAYIHPDDIDQVDKSVAWALNHQSGGHYDLTYRTIGADDGLIRWVRFIGQGYFAQTGEAYRFAGVAQDVTDERAYQQPVEQSELRFQAMVEQSPMAIGLLSGRDMVIESGNAKLFELWGKSSSITGMRLIDALPEIKNQAFIGLLEGVYDTGVPYFGDNVQARLWRNGKLETVYFDFAYTPLRDTSQAVTGVMVLATEVTAQVITRQAIEASEAKLRSVIATAPAAMGLFVGRDLIVDLPNQSFIDIVGKGPDIVGKPLRDVMPELDNQPFLQILDDVYTTGQMYQSFGTQVDIVQQGVMTHNFYNITYTPLLDEHRSVYAILDIAIDVTEEVKARQKLEESEFYSRSIIENSPVPKMIFQGKDMIISTANEKMLDMLSRTTSIIGKPFMEAIPELAETPLLTILQRVYTTGETYHEPEGTIDLIRNGQVYKGIYNFTYKALRNTAGVIYGIINTAFEVTEQVRNRQQIEQSEQRFRQAVEQAPVAILVLKGDQLILETANQTMLTLIDRTADVIGQPIEAIMPELAGQNLFAICHQVYQTGKPYLGWEDEVWLNRNGHIEPSYFNVAYTPYHEGDTITGVMQVVTEVTDQVKANRQIKESEARYRKLASELELRVEERTKELQNANTDLRRSNENLEQFAYIASHDLQEPLRKIQQFSDLLKVRYIAQPNEDLNYLERMQSAASRMSLLIRDLLTFSRISTGQVPLEPVSLQKAIDQAVDNLAISIEETNAVIHVGSLPTIRGDASQLSQLFQNLLSNSLKFSRTDRLNNRIIPRISVTAKEIISTDLPPLVKPSRQVSHYHKIEVSDNGIGFEEKYLSRIFQVFQRLHGRNEFAGTGIGLAICEKVVANHGGAITATSQPGQGACFHIYFPA